MTEFYQLQEPRDHSLAPTNLQEPVIETLKDESSQEEFPLEATAEMNAFRYYYCGDGQSPLSVSSPLAKRSNKSIFSPRYLARNSVIGATLISGVVIAGLANTSKPQSPQNLTQSEVKQTPTSNLAQPQVAPPEVMPQLQSTLAKSPQKSKKALPKPSLVALEQLSAKQLSQQAVAQQMIAVPELPPNLDLPTVAVTVPQSLPKPLPAPPVRPSAQIAPLQKSPTNSLPTSPLIPIYKAETTIAPIPLQTSPPPPAHTGAATIAPAPLQTSPLPSTYKVGAAISPAPPIALPILEPATLPQPTADDRCFNPTAEAEKSATDLRSTSVQTSLPVSAPESVVTVASSKAQLEKSMLVKAPQTIAAQAPSLPDAEKELQTLLELPKKFPTSAGIAVLPLPCQAAQAAIAKPQMGEFAVLKLSPQDYQKRWKMSSNNSPATIPAYGFIDYKQHAIVLMQKSSG